MLAKLKHRLFLLKKLFVIDSNEKAFVAFANEMWGDKSHSHSSGELLIDAVAHNPYIFQTAYFANLFAAKYDLTIKTVLPVIETNTALVYRYFYCRTVIRKLYHAFGSQDGLDYFSSRPELLRR